MVALVLPQATLRMHDNPLLKAAASDADDVVFLVDERRCSTQAPERHRIDSAAWSIPQAALFVQAVQAHARDLAAAGYRVRIVVTKSPTKEVKRLSKTYDTVYTDRVHDPELDSLARALVSAFDTVHVVETRAMIDWSDETSDAHEHAERTFGDSAFRHTTKLKAYIHGVCKAATIPRTPQRSSGAKGSVRGAAKLEAIGARLAKSADKLGIELYPFDEMLVCRKGASLDAGVRRVAKKAARIVGAKGWSKPKTARNLGLLEHAADSTYDSSKMSPLLSLGLLSARSFYRMCLRKRVAVPTVGSGADQLLFRECWYACASIDDDRTRFWSASPGWWKKTSAARRVASTQLRKVWSEAPTKVRQWYAGTMDEEWVDANESMERLRSSGWLHHLRRHLVADVLCKGQLQQPFLYGQLWFRRTLVDHDAVLNRANWMWLSASAFSSKQNAFHYSPKDYIQRNSHEATRDSRRVLGCGKARRKKSR